MQVRRVVDPEEKDRDSHRNANRPPARDHQASKSIPTRKRYVMARQLSAATAALRMPSGVIPEHWPRLMPCRPRNREPRVDRKQSKDSWKQEEAALKGREYANRYQGNGHD